MDQPPIRRATPDDARLLADLGALTFTQTFGHLYAPGDLADFLSDSYSPERLAAYLGDPRSAAWIMEHAGEAIGYALAGACDLPHPDVTDRCGELKRIYMRADWQGGGRGSRLLNLSLDWLESSGPRALWIGVWSENFGAQRLYGRLGFEKVGEYDFAVGAHKDREFILRRAP
jgi:GNAT superfamily N-acetyltransferase